MRKLAVLLSYSLWSLLRAEEGVNVFHGRGYLPPEKNLPVDEKSKQYFNRIMMTPTSVPESYSSADEGLVSPVKNQYKCGACVAFATAAVLETCYKKVSGVFGDYSEQELIDCAYGKHGAGGCEGAPSNSYARWLDEKKRQLTHESNYPYKNMNTSYTCPRNLEPYNRGAKITGHYFERDGNEEELKRLVFQNGAAIACLYTSGEKFKAYSGGIFDSCNSGDKTDHCVAVVGYGAEEGVDYWLIKNSWGADWGEKGFMRLKRGENMCGIGKEIVTITCERDETPTDAPLTTETPCLDRWNNCHDLANDYCYEEDISAGCRKSCGLCEGMTPHPSNTCYDKWNNCPELKDFCNHDQISRDCKKSCGNC